MMKIAVLDDWQGIARRSADWSGLESKAELTFFDTAFSDEDHAATALGGFDIVMAMRERTPFPASLVSRLPRLKLFTMTGGRGSTIDFEALRAQGITICGTDGGRGGMATAELALGLMLASARDIPAADAGVRAGEFQQGLKTGYVLAGRTLGLVGLGKIGARMAGYGNALGMEVIAWSQNLKEDTAAAAGAAAVSKDELFRRADVVSLHCVLSERTRHMIGASDLALMKPGALLINTSRGPLVDEDALVQALQSQRISAALDTYHREPLPIDHPLRTAPNTVLTPHLGYCAGEIMEMFYKQGIENVLAFLDGEPIRVIR
jgi:phosphoglycerate dehydrogenase-like enzyme